MSGPVAGSGTPSTRRSMRNATGRTARGCLAACLVATGLGAACLGAAGTPALAQIERPTFPRSLPRPTDSRADIVPAADDDARRAAAARLLSASRFRDRQAVLLKDALRAAEAELAEECLNRATTGQSMKTCQVIAAPRPATKARIAAAEGDMLDEIMAASQSIYAHRFAAAEMDEITRFFRTPVGQRYGAIYPQILIDVQSRKRAIARRYLAAAGARQ